MPGDSVNTNFTISNPSNVEVALRASINESWNNGSLNNQLDNGEDVVIKELGSDWVYYNGYYYYQNKLSTSSDSSTTLFNKLTFNLNVEAGVNCTTVDDVRECSSNGYTNSTYKLTITYEFIASDAISNWDYNPFGNQYIKAAYTYDESTCQTGNEETCVATTCYTSGTCPVGTIIDYQVDSSTTDNTQPIEGVFPKTGIMRFHVLSDDGTTITMQSQKNVVNGVAWYSSADNNSYGPTTIVPALETATNGWSNVKTLNTIYSTSQSKCTLSGNTTSCTDGYPTYTRSGNKARLITLTEATSTSIGNCSLSPGSCKKFMTNYLSQDSSYNNTYYDSTFGNNGYWTSSADGSYATGAWDVYKGYVNSYVTSATYTVGGARAVVEIDRNPADFVVSNPNENIVENSVKKYDETIITSGSPNVYKCVTGDESTCEISNCMTDKHVGSCVPGTIVSYKVNDNETKRFHVLKDNGSTVLLQDERNTVAGTAWYSGGNDNSQGPTTIMPVLENATKDWSNVNDLTYSIGKSSDSLGYSACTLTSGQTLSNCSTTKFTFSRTSNLTNHYKARMITGQETATLGCKWGTNQSCPIWVYNYLNGSTSYGGNVVIDTNYYYWTMSARANYDNSAILINFDGKVSPGYTSKTDYGARAVVEINK